MKIGDYVRTKDGIKKVLKYTYNEKYENGHCVWFDNKDYGILFTDEEVNKMKPSPNIIDLIEVGDVITFKDDEDVYKVIGRPDKKCALEVFYLAKKYDGNTEDIMVYPDEMKKYIKSIVTKEQFSCMEYKIGDE